MNKARFPYLAALLGGFLLILLLAMDHGQPGSGFSLPLLTLLVISEFGFILTAIGTWLGVQQLVKNETGAAMIAVSTTCAVFAVAFAVLGIGYWPL